MVFNHYQLMSVVADCLKFCLSCPLRARGRGCDGPFCRPVAITAIGCVESTADQLALLITVIQKICKRLALRQQVIATAITFFRRFYLRNSYCDTDPPLVAAACCYVASKAEETPVHVKVALTEARTVLNLSLIHI